MNKELKRELTRITAAKNVARSNWSFKNVRTLGAMLQNLGYTPAEILYVYGPEQAQKEITFSELNEYFRGLEINCRLRHTEKTAKANEDRTEDYEGLSLKHSSEDIRLPDSGEIIEWRPGEGTEEDEEGSIVIPEGEDSSPWQAQPEGQDAVLTKPQQQVAKAIFDDIWFDRQQGQMLLAGTGTGKTYVIGNILRNLINLEFHKLNNCYSPWPYVYTAPNSVVLQTEEVFEDEFGLEVNGGGDVHVINIEQLRASFGEIFIEDKLEIINGQEHRVFTWRPYVHPLFIAWDENQILKNETSTQSLIAQAYNRVSKLYGVKTYQVCASATPFARVSETRHFSLATGILSPYGVIGREVPLTDENWNSFAAGVAYPSDPIDYCGAAMERYRKLFSIYIKQMKNVRSKFKALNRILGIRFRTKEEQEYYASAWDRFLEEKAKIEGNDSLTGSQSRMQILTQFLKFRMAAEECRAEWIADFFHETWESGIQSPVAAISFVTTGTRICKFLHEKYGWSRDDISIIWGGNVKGLNKKKRAAKQLYDLGIDDVLKDVGVNMSDLGFTFTEEELQGKSEEDLAFEKVFRLGPQDKYQRQIEKRRFQKQKSRGCIFTFKAGGIGLSLHHAYPEARQRAVVLTPVYSFVELIQGLGRCPRLTSLSDTPQVVVHYLGTIEDQVAARVQMKLKSLKSFVNQRESWEDIIINSEGPDDTADEIAKALLT